MFNAKHLNKMDFAKLDKNLAKLCQDYRDAYQQHIEDWKSGYIDASLRWYDVMIVRRTRWQQCSGAHLYAWHLQTCHSDGSECKDGCGNY